MRERLPEDEAIEKAREKRRRIQQRRLDRAIRLAAQMICRMEREAKAIAAKSELDAEAFLDFLEEKIGIRPLERRVSKIPENGDPHTNGQKRANWPIAFTKLQ